jgi:hypothetical protein
MGTARVDYEYQAEMWVQDIIEKDHPMCVRVDVPLLGRKWKREADGKMLEVK